MSKASDTKEHTFETAIARLENLVTEMESDRMPLEQLLVAYEEGAKLVKVCQQKLTEAEKKIEIIQRKVAGEIELKEYDPAAKAESPAPARKPAVKDVSLF
jgi:exodeoxyribonuclease VII small subunit